MRGFTSGPVDREVGGGGVSFFNLPLSGGGGFGLEKVFGPFPVSWMRVLSGGVGPLVGSWNVGRTGEAGLVGVNGVFAPSGPFGIPGGVGLMVGILLVGVGGVPFPVEIPGGVILVLGGLMVLLNGGLFVPLKVVGMGLVGVLRPLGAFSGACAGMLKEATRGLA